MSNTTGSATWLRRLLIGTGVTLSVLLLLTPLLLIFIAAFASGVGGIISNLPDADMLHAIGLTLLVAGLTVPINLIFGTLIAWCVTRFTFPGRRLLLTLIDIPFAVSPVVAGLLYLLLYGKLSDVFFFLFVVRRITNINIKKSCY